MKHTYLLNKLHKLIHILSLSKPYFRNDRTIRKIFQEKSISGESFALDIGSGPIPKNPFDATIVYGADIRNDNKNEMVYCSDLSSGTLPFDSNHFDFVTAFDVLEHIPRVSYSEGVTKFPFIFLMNEIFRVLKLGGFMFSIQPCFPSKSAFQDPTHVNIMTEDTIYLYFCEPLWARIYGYDGTFSLIKDGWIGEKYFSFIKKTHDIPIRDMDFIQK